MSRNAFTAAINDLMGLVRQHTDLLQALPEYGSAIAEMQRQMAEWQDF